MFRNRPHVAALAPTVLMTSAGHWPVRKRQRLRSLLRRRLNPLLRILSASNRVACFASHLRTSCQRRRRSLRQRKERNEQKLRIDAADSK